MRRAPQQLVNAITPDVDYDAAGDIKLARELDRGVITQDGFARVFATRFKGKLRYCHHAGRWFHWAETHWQPNDTEIAFEFVRVLCRELTEQRDAKDLKEVRKVSFASGVEKFARSDPVFAVTASAWDQDRYLLGSPGGTADLRTGKLRRSDPTEGITRTTAIAPSARSDCPIWRQFLNEACAFDADLVEFLRRWFGYCLTGDVREHTLLFGHGPGGNGKSVMLNTATKILKDYAVVAPADTFTASINDRHPTDLAMLRGARLVAASETEHGRTWAEARIKQLTGGDPITARFMRRDFFTFEPEFKLVVIGNHQPSLVNVDDAVRRRMAMVPFTAKPKQPDMLLEEKLRQEWPAILRWMIEGALDWQRSGLERPRVVLEATSQYFDEQNVFDQWLDDCCEQRGSSRESSASLFGSWSKYANSVGERPGSKKAFGSVMKKRFSAFREGRMRGFNGLRLRSAESAE